MAHPDQLRQPAVAGRASFDALGDFLREETSWFSESERRSEQIRRSSPGVTSAEVVRALVDQDVIRGSARLYKAVRLLAEAGLQPDNLRERTPRALSGIRLGNRFASRADYRPAVGRDVQREQGVRTVGERETVSVLCITGPAGMGKTQLADEIVTAACDSESAGPRLEICVSSAETSTESYRVAKTAYDALLDLLCMLGVPEHEIPATLEERHDRYLAELAGQRPIVFIDDAVDVSQVLPLIPPEKGLVVVTSRCSLPELSGWGAEYIPVEALTPDEARLLIQDCFQLSGIEPDDATIIAIHQWCGGVPSPIILVSRWMAVTAKAKRAAGGGEHVQLAELTTRLDTARRVEEALSYGDDAADERPGHAVVGAIFSLLSEDQRAVLRSLGLPRIPEADIETICVGSGLTQRYARDALDQLIGMGLVESAKPGSAWWMEPLVADYVCAHALAQNDAGRTFERTLGPIFGLTDLRAKNLRDLMCSQSLDSSPRLQEWVTAEWKAERDTFAISLGAATAFDHPGMVREFASAVADMAGRDGTRRETERYFSPILTVARDAGDHGLEAEALLRIGSDVRRQGEAGSALLLLTAAEQAVRLVTEPALHRDIGHELELLAGMPGRAERSPGQPFSGWSGDRAVHSDGLGNVEKAVMQSIAVPTAPMIFGVRRGVRL